MVPIDGFNRIKVRKNFYSVAYRYVVSAINLTDKHILETNEENEMVKKAGNQRGKIKSKDLLLSKKMWKREKKRIHFNLFACDTNRTLLNQSRNEFLSQWFLIKYNANGIKKFYVHF